MKIYPTAATRYVTEAGRIRTPASKRSFLNVMALLQYHIGDTPIDKVTTEQLTRFCLARNPAPGTIKHRRAHLRAFFEWAAWAKLCPTNPASDLKFTVSAPNRITRPGNWYTEQDVRTFIEAAVINPDPFVGERDKLIIMTGFLTGLRGQEIADIRWSSFNHDMTAVQVIGKGRKHATIAVPPQLRAALQHWRRHVPAGCDTVFPMCREKGMRGGSDLASWDQPLGYDGLYQTVKRVGARAGHPQLAPHDMRRTFAALLETKGVPVTDISRALRHGDVGITSRYLDRNPAKAVAVTADFTLDF